MSNRIKIIIFTLDLPCQNMHRIYISILIELHHTQIVEWLTLRDWLKSLHIIVTAIEHSFHGYIFKPYIWLFLNSWYIQNYRIFLPNGNITELLRWYSWWTSNPAKYRPYVIVCAIKCRLIVNYTFSDAYLCASVCVILCVELCVYARHMYV